LVPVSILVACNVLEGLTVLGRNNYDARPLKREDPG
jgi:hypothetical protein